MTVDQSTLDREQASAESLSIPIATILREAQLARGEVVPSLDRVQSFLMLHLPKLVGLLESRLISRREAAGAIADRFVVWCADERRQPFHGTDESWDIVVGDVMNRIRDANLGSIDDWGPADQADDGLRAT